MRTVIIESPYAGDVEANTAYARAAVSDALGRGEAPLASHLLYSQPGVLDDGVPDERRLGIKAGLAWAELADATVVYIDGGISTGMRAGIHHAKLIGRPIEYRSLDPEIGDLDEYTGPSRKDFSETVRAIMAPVVNATPRLPLMSDQAPYPVDTDPKE